MLPSIFGERMFDDLFGFPTFPEFPDVEKKLYGRNALREMKTDVHEHDDRFEVDIDLPGFKKEEISLDLENGYLTVAAHKGVSNDKTDKKGKLIRQERYQGSMQRSFYVGKGLTAQDVKAKFENGVLSLTLPKKQETLPEKKTIMIE